MSEPRLDKDSLLLWLDDIEVREKIRQIMSNTDDKEVVETAYSVSSVSENHDVEDLNTETEISDNANLLSQLQDENQDMNAIIKKLKSLLGLKEQALDESNEVLSTLNQNKTALETELSSKASRLSSTEADLNQNKQNLSDLTGKHENLQVELGTLKSNHQEQEKKIAFYRTSFEEDLRIKEIYEGFSAQTKLSTEGIFKDTSIKGLIACGIQDKNISNLWDYVKSEVVNGNNPDQERLIRLFELLFNRFKLAYPMFALQQIEAGDKFDTQSHIKHNRSTNMSGNIQDVLLHGYVNTKNGKVIKPSVVVV